MFHDRYYKLTFTSDDIEAGFSLVLATTTTTTTTTTIVLICCSLVFSKFN